MVAGKAHSTAEYAKVAQRNSVCCVEGGAQNLVSLDSGDTLRQGRALGDGKVVHQHLVECSGWVLCVSQLRTCTRCKCMFTYA